MLQADKDRYGYKDGEKVSIMDQRIRATIADEVNMAKEYGDDYFYSGTSKMFGRLQRGLGDSGEGLRAFTELRKINNQMDGKYSNEDLASQLNQAYRDAGLSYTFTLPEKFQSDRVKKAEGGDPNEGITELRKVAPEVVERMGYEEGGMMGDQMGMLMEPQEPPMESEMPMESDEEMEDNYLDFIIDEALSEEEEDMLMSKLEQDEQLSMLLDKVIEVASEFAGSGPVEGPGSGVSDSIPARLSDGEFVFTAKATEEIGADELMRMMKDAEARANERQGMVTGGEVEEEDTVVVSGEEEPARQEIRVVKETVDSAGRIVQDEDEISKNIRSQMMLDPKQQHVRS